MIQAQQYHAASQPKSSQNYPMNGITVIKENNIVMNGNQIPTNQNQGMMGRRLAD